MLLSFNDKVIQTASNNTSIIVPMITIKNENGLMPMALTAPIAATVTVDPIMDTNAIIVILEWTYTSGNEFKTQSMIMSINYHRCLSAEF